MMYFRNEWKYEISNKERALLSEKLSHFLEKDINADKTYLIKSLYFDDYINNFAKNTEAGLNKRYKYRIRYYNDEFKKLKFEKKSKLFGMCNKQVCGINIDTYNEIINNNYNNLLYIDNKLLRDFAVFSCNNIIRPKCIIEYKRQAFVDDNFNIRITFDNEIYSSSDIAHFLDSNYSKYPIFNSNTNILEIKFDYILPSYISSIFNDMNLSRQTFSKYYNGMKTIQEME